MLIKRRLRFGSFEFQNCQYVIIGTDAGGDDAQAIVLTVAEAKRTTKLFLESLVSTETLTWMMLPGIQQCSH